MALKKRYSDLDFKFKKLASGDVNKVYDENAINQSLTSLFNTLPGERFFNLNYGSNIPALLFEPFDALTANTLLTELRDAIKIWEDVRIEIVDLEVEMDLVNVVPGCLWVPKIASSRHHDLFDRVSRLTDTVDPFVVELRGDLRAFDPHNHKAILHLVE